MKKYLISTLFITFFLPFFTHASDYSNGTLLKADNDVKVYVIQNNHKRWIKTADIFNSYSYDWKKIKIITKNELDKINDANLIKISDDPKVYLLENNIKHWIPTAEIFNQKDLDWNNIQAVNKSDFDSYLLGNDLTNKTINYSQSSVSVFLNHTSYNGKCLLNKPTCPYPLASKKHNDILNLTFEVIGSEKVKLTKLVIKQWGQLDDYENPQFSKSFGEIVNNTITFYPDLILGGREHYSVYADFQESSRGKTFQFSIEAIEFIGADTGLPVKYNSPNGLLDYIYYLFR